jgi:hypothetical protein
MQAPATLGQARHRAEFMEKRRYRANWCRSSRNGPGSRDHLRAVVGAGSGRPYAFVCALMLSRSWASSDVRIAAVSPSLSNSRRYNERSHARCRRTRPS